MAVLTIGRVGLDLTKGDGGISGPAAGLSWSGDGMSLTGEIKARTLDGAKALRDQLRALADSVDEPVVPVTWDEDPTVDGYYEVLSVEVGTVAASYSANWFPIDVELVRVPGWQSPILEVLTRGAARSNDHGLTNGNLVSFVGLPGTELNVTRVSTEGTFSFGSETLDGGGKVAKLSCFPNEAADLFDNEIVFQTPMEYHYEGAPRLELRDPPQVVVGRQIPNTPDYWRITNDAVRVTANEATNCSFVVDIYDSAVDGWVSSKTYRVIDNGSLSDPTDAVTTTVLENSVTRVALRVWYDGSSFDKTAYVDFAVTRGQPFVEVTVNGRSGDWGIYRTTVEAGEPYNPGIAGAVDGGIIAASDDGDGHKYTVVCAAATTTDNTNGGVYLTTGAGTATFGVGTDLGNAAGNNPIDRFFAAQALSQRTTAR